ncbi:hypothetical protein A3K48_01755 [candidate division WOR-1 bacterium RIFOXYA12_FULL_52_29]|uniref:Uncharacterized protein n=1 Tax=candidate division WOR-1 bacterium RIFOXYC12_FULL_54_18 TaxID=1802584 RepID=A0A1F4T4T1_UNCSA|nr:MAG: hypothetical protein A3K44_01755 [candidate division WOR-1 bacterium RIFOXYA2_FULL_51_19]OGC17307.1 MAG: hypothetical protein A3K48_01755 [candidate division WOR-1 bacterium RIFOXYA12_FULL_52_29]OGC26167.1 MAG: hypothetical protein A3K32_01750 [candidate division WOR-1 bacterium RIFOXYB2_FULL_45_9]OGC27724.1 MAG: hypothetical protein A3K49_01755 [candidate division WOR-1 bacterium RIFOXYC12_FULL_54_18]OGC29985.1 MAG: hypothetical protein A2346_04580 [candidate division WOR-1 bacterium R
MNKHYENYPVWIPALSILLSLSIYSLGAIILSGFGQITVILYLLFCLWSEYRVLAGACRSCYYYGKLCGPGKGIIAPLFFKKDDPKKFTAKVFGWRDLVPDLLLFLIPFLGGLVYLFVHFNWLTLVLMIANAILAFPVTGYMRGTLLCPNCKQRELGCPAEKLFAKK